MQYVEYVGHRKTNGSMMQPFLKWAGGKRWLVRNYIELFPQQYGKYIEPFMGSGAVFFALNPESGIIGDVNKDLIECYESIRDDWHSVLLLLHKHHKSHSYDYYYSTRRSRPRIKHRRAAKLIYLNRTCWNGLYRVNLRGEFNVPIGTKNKVVMENDNFEEVANRLKNFKLKHSDFEKTIDEAKEGDLVFADPPYTVRHNHNSFIKYNEHLFSWDDQLRLLHSLHKAKKRGVKIVATNAGHDCINELYGDTFSLTKVSRNSSISSKFTERGRYEEFIITANI